MHMEEIWGHVASHEKQSKMESYVNVKNHPFTRRQTKFDDWWGRRQVMSHASRERAAHAGLTCLVKPESHRASGRTGQRFTKEVTLVETRVHHGSH